MSSTIVPIKMAVIDWFTVGGPGTSDNGATTIMIMTGTGDAELVMGVEWGGIERDDHMIKC